MIRTKREDAWLKEYKQELEDQMELMRDEYARAVHEVEGLKLKVIDCQHAKHGMQQEYDKMREENDAILQEQHHWEAMQKKLCKTVAEALGGEDLRHTSLQIYCQILSHS